MRPSPSSANTTRAGSGPRPNVLPSPRRGAGRPAIFKRTFTMSTKRSHHKQSPVSEAAARLSDTDVRTGMDAVALRQAVADHLRYSIGHPAVVTGPRHYYHALALAVRDRLQD